MIAVALAFTMTGCGNSTTSAVSELTAESKPATQYTIDANQEVYALLDFEDTAEFENATKGLIASPDTLDICGENCTGTLHNLYTLRGAQVRDGNAWAEYIMESLALYGDKADVTWTTKRAGLLSIAQKNAENAAALIEEEGDETCLTRLMDAVTVTSEYKYFNII